MELRNIAIIAHVDHGKSTLVDALLKQSKTNLGKLADTDLIMDSNELERERGITIFSKNASVQYAGVKLNIIDTPGHADFGGEVERVLQMADGSLLLIDAQEGPMPQTRFVLKKALDAGHKILVVINKIDKPNARVNYVLDKVIELFIELGATNDQLDFPILYGSGKLGLAGPSAELDKMTSITPLFDAILEHVPEPQVKKEGPFQMMVVSVGADNYLGRIAIGRIERGTITSAMPIARVREGAVAKQKVTGLMTFIGLQRAKTEEATAGDIIALAGCVDAMIGDTITAADAPDALTPIAIEKPTVKMSFSVNTSPFAGNEGEYGTSRNIRERLAKELETDVALRVEDGTTMDEFIVSGRGEMHLAILIEKMRREGYELQASKPQVIFVEQDGQTMEPAEDVWIEAPEEYVGPIMQKMNERRADLKNMHVDEGVAQFHFFIPTRNFIGFRSECTIDTKGTAIVNTLFAGYFPKVGDIQTKTHGSLVAHELGSTTPFALVKAQDRGVLFLGPGSEVYEGQVVGQHAKPGDLVVNVCKTKHLTNIRSKGDGVADSVVQARLMSLEQALEYIGDDELVEVTPKNIRIRKKILRGALRK
jgi:GTP-binding protein